ncbi:MAG: anaerobic ribonucleoside-triphosphate reductase activating protein [Anaerolineae bacterium]|nr:anaerobic ribonucleoside-triphosphate reductase activating protein [Anaerolineae bacterium]
MQIGGLQKFSLIDYPGKLACVIFTRGCNFRCPYCHNPELVCPESYLRPIEAEYLWKFLHARRYMLDAVVVSGGEPTIHHDLPEFLEKIKSMGYAIKLDTNGSLPQYLAEVMELRLVDFIAMDVKASLARYQKVTRAHFTVAAIEESIQLIKNSGIPHEFRTTVVKSLCGEEELKSIHGLIKGCQTYRLQRARIDEHILDPDLVKTELFSEEEFSMLCQRWEIRSASAKAM